MKVELDLSNYIRKLRLKNAISVDTLDFDVDKLDNDKLKKLPSKLSYLKSKVDKLDIEN